MSVSEILFKIFLACVAYERAVNSENGLVIAFSIAYLIIGGIGFLLMGLLEEVYDWVDLAAGVIMLTLAGLCRWHHWVPFKRRW